jgi:hypothetical protein
VSGPGASRSTHVGGKRCVRFLGPPLPNRDRPFGRAQLKRRIAVADITDNPFVATRGSVQRGLDIHVTVARLSVNAHVRVLANVDGDAGVGSPKLALRALVEHPVERDSPVAGTTVDLAMHVLDRDASIARCEDEPARNVLERKPAVR